MAVRTSNLLVMDYRLGMRETNLQNLMLSELYSSASYIDRIFHAMVDVSGLAYLPQAKHIAEEFYFELVELIEREVLSLDLRADYLPPTFSEIRLKVKSMVAIMEAVARLDFNQEEMFRKIVSFINVIYSYAHKLHKFCHDHSNLEIQLPRVNLLQEEFADRTGLVNSAELESGEWQSGETLKDIPLFKITWDSLEQLRDGNLCSVNSLEWQRDKKYEGFINEGHELIFHKKPKQALKCFNKALNYKETAEVLTLIGWNYSLLDQNDKAKSFCLKAIQKDPDYGPPYNDLGTYLLSEGQIDESLKWFELAKKTTKYQNREYPYINAGRAYMAKKNISKALEEFSKALTLAPYHEELHQTVHKLKSSIYKNVELKARKKQDQPEPEASTNWGPPSDDSDVWGQDYEPPPNPFS